MEFEDLATSGDLKAEGNGDKQCNVKHIPNMAAKEVKVYSANHVLFSNLNSTFRESTTSVYIIQI